MHVAVWMTWKGEKNINWTTNYIKNLPILIELNVYKNEIKTKKT